jgi:DegV family protein with EDD domain
MNSRHHEQYEVDLVPFKLFIGDEEYVDDEDLDVLAFIRHMVETPLTPKSACPSPNDFFERLDPEVDNYIVTISSALSGTHNSANLARQMFLEKYPDGFCHIFDSKSASIAETLISQKIHDLHRAGVPRAEIVRRVDAYIAKMRTFFIAESLDNLMKNGRISKVTGTIATALDIKPVMGANDDGEIVPITKARGTKRAYKKLVSEILANAPDASERILAISHVNNLERAEMLKEELERKTSFKEIQIVQTGGLSSLYCDNQGIIVAF